MKYMTLKNYAIACGVSVPAIQSRIKNGTVAAQRIYGPDGVSSMLYIDTEAYPPQKGVAGRPKKK